MIEESVDRRVLGAVRFVDAVSRLPVMAPLLVRADGVSWVRNRRNLYVIVHAPGLDAHTAEWLAPPDEPAIGSVRVELTVRDGARRYLARRAVVRLPRDPDAERAAERDSLFQPADIALYPAPSSGVAAGWSVVRGAVAGAAPNTTLAHALVRVVGAGDALLARAMSDERGEVLVAVPNIPVTTFDGGDGPVLATQVDATLQVVHDPVAAVPPDPDDLEARRAALQLREVAVRLAAGRRERLTL
jgi:hypothetical protein